MTNTNLPSLAPRTFDEMMQFCETISKSSFCPKDYKDKPGEILVAIQYGSEIGLKAMQSLQNIAVINGRPCVWGDSLLALVQASGLLEYIEETDDGKEATCIVKRKGYPNPHTATFSMEDAKSASLNEKAGPWKQYPKRMRQMRARGFSLRDQFADVLGGLIAREEAIDITPIAEDVQQLDMSALTPEETPGTVEADEIKLIRKSTIDMAMDEHMEVTENTSTAEVMVYDELSTPAEQKVFITWFNNHPMPYPEKKKKLDAVCKGKPIKEATKRQLQTVRDALGDAK